MTSLPTRIRQHIRDYVESPSSSLVVKTKALTSTLGYPVTFDPEWPMLWETLKTYYPDSATFIPNVARVVIAWCDAFTSWLESKDNEDAVERLLDTLTNGGQLKLSLEVMGSSRPKTAWDSKRNAFVINLQKAPPPSICNSQAGFSSDLSSLFSSPDAVDGLVEDSDAWADLSVESPETQFLPRRMKRVEKVCDFLPELSAIERPEELTKRPPYWLNVIQQSSTRVIILGSHGPSLVLLEGYLKKWCRGDVNRVQHPPLVEIKLQESVFGLGLMYDSLILEAVRGREVNPILVLVLVESVLGYQAIEGTTSGAGTWEFKRMYGFN